jgi:hypothetical protein
MNWDLQNTSVLLLGAGFSAAATDGKMPLMKGYFDKLSKTQHPALFEFVSEVGCNHKCALIQDANVEKVLLTLEQMKTAPEEMFSGSMKQHFINASVIESELIDYSLERLKGSLEVDDTNWAAKLLAESGTDTTVVSMNYDNIAERVLSSRKGLRHFGQKPTCPHCRMRRLLERACSCGQKDSDVAEFWQGAVVKPHGSIAWKRCNTQGCCMYDCLVADAHCQPFERSLCNRCNQECSPVLVMPTMSKNYGHIKEISTMWNAMYQAIVHAESILLFGFSLPTSDELLIQQIRAAISEGKRLRVVGSIDINPESVLDRFELCLPPGLAVQQRQFPVVPGEIPLWVPEFTTEFVGNG